MPIAVQRTAEISTAQRIWTLFVLCTGVALVMLTLTGPYVAAAEMGVATGASQTELTWIIDAYTLTLAGLLIPAGALGDRFGRRGVMIVGLVLFVVSSAAMVVVESVPMLILVRGITGVAAALVMPSTLSLITSVFPEEKRAQGVAIWSAVSGTAGCLGVLFGGVLMEWFSWRSTFWMILVTALVTLVLSATIPTSRASEPPPLDPWGAISSAVAIGAAVFGLIEAGHKGWSQPEILASFAIALAAGTVFVFVQLRRRDPLLDVRVFRIRVFGASAFAILILFASVYGQVFLVLIYLQYILDYSPLVAGITITAGGAFGVLLCGLANPLADRFGIRSVVVLGLLLSAASYLILMRVGVDGGPAVVIVGQAVASSTIGLTLPICTNAIMENVPEAKQGVASAVNHSTREVGTAVGIAAFGSILSYSYTDGVRTATELLPAPARDAARESLPGAVAVAQQSGPAGAPLIDTARDAFVAGTHDVFLVMFVVMLASAVAIGFWMPGRVRSGSALPDPPATATIHGRVRTTGHAPVPAACLTLLDLEGHALAQARTDHDGRYRLAVPRSGSTLLVCTHDELPPHIRTVNRTDVPSQVDFVLSNSMAASTVTTTSRQY